MLSATDPIVIRFFGAFTIQYGDVVISENDNRSKKLWKLLEYILQNRGRQIPQEELLRLLWSEDSMGDNPMSSLKTLLHRVRNTLDQLNIEESRNLILQHAGTYFWNPGVPVKVDTDEFEVAAQRTKKVDIPEEKLNYALRAMALYKGQYLSGQYVGEAWADEPANRYQQLYLYCYNAAIQILAGESRYDEIIFLSRHAMEINPSEELYYYNLISALIEKGAWEEALTAYEDVLDLFYHTYRKTPSDRLRALYRGIVRSSNSVEMDIAIVREKLEEGREFAPISCEYDTFKLLYQLRSHQEFTNPAYLILFTILSSNKNEPVPADRYLDRALNQLERQLSLSLSEGDVYTRYSLTQMLAIASLPGEDELFAFLKKIQQTFKYNNLSCPVEISYKAERI